MPVQGRDELALLGRTFNEMASQLQTQDPTATQISRGAGSAGGGAMSLYDAVKLAAKQPAQQSSDNARLGYQYYMFGAPGSPACTVASPEKPWMTGSYAGACA